MALPFASLSSSAPLREWASLRGPELARLDRDRTAVVVTCSPLEVHGPHLPVMADCLESEAILARTLERFGARHPELQFLHLPAVYVASDVLPKPGSLMFRPRTVLSVMQDLGRTLAVQGFRHIWISSFHGGPRHFVPIEIACHRTNRRYGTRMVSLLSLVLAQLTGGRTDAGAVFRDLPGLTDADLAGDAHAGVVETSLHLHLCRELVDPSYRELPASLPTRRRARQGRTAARAVDRPSLLELVVGFGDKLRYYAEQTYAGRPALASAELGERMLEALADHAAQALDDVWTGELPAAACHSPLWRARWLFMNRPVGWLAERIMGYRQSVF